MKFIKLRESLLKGLKFDVEHQLEINNIKLKNTFITHQMMITEKMIQNCNSIKIKGNVKNLNNFKDQLNDKLKYFENVKHFNDSSFSSLLISNIICELIGYEDQFDSSLNDNIQLFVMLKLYEKDKSAHLQCFKNLIKLKDKLKSNLARKQFYKMQLDSMSANEKADVVNLMINIAFLFDFPNDLDSNGFFEQLYYYTIQKFIKSLFCDSLLIKSSKVVEGYSRSKQLMCSMFDKIKYNLIDDIKNEIINSINYNHLITLGTKLFVYDELMQLNMTIWLLVMINSPIISKFLIENANSLSKLILLTPVKLNLISNYTQEIINQESLRMDDQMILNGKATLISDYIDENMISEQQVKDRINAFISKEMKEEKQNINVQDIGNGVMILNLDSLSEDDSIDDQAQAENDNDIKFGDEVKNIFVVNEEMALNCKPKVIKNIRNTNPSEYERQLTVKYNHHFYPSKFEPSEFNKILLARFLRTNDDIKIKCENNKELQSKIIVQIVIQCYNKFFQIPYIDASQFNKFGGQAGMKLMSFMKYLMENELNDPQYRKCLNVDSILDSCICKDGSQQRFLDVKSMESIVKENNKLNNAIKMVELPGERYPWLIGKTIQDKFKGEMKMFSSNEDGGSKAQAIRGRLNRMIDLQNQLNNDMKKSEEYKFVSRKVLDKINETNDDLQMFAFKSEKYVDNTITIPNLLNLITINQMINEVVNELNSMNVLSQSINVALSKKQTIDNYINHDKNSGTDENDNLEFDSQLQFKKYINDKFFINESGVIMTSEGATTISFDEFIKVIESIDSNEIGRLKMNKFRIRYYSKTYDNITVHAFRLKESSKGETQKYHVCISLHENGKNYISEVHVYTLSELDVDAKNFHQLAMLSGTWNNNSIDYHLMQLYVRRPGQRKADMLTNLEFAIKHRKSPLTAWKIYYDKIKDIEFGNTSDVNFLKWCLWACLDACPQTQYTFGLFTAANRQSPKEMATCYDNVLRETPAKDRLRYQLVQEMLTDLKENFDEYFDAKEIVNQLSQMRGLDLNKLMSTASSTNYRMPHKFDYQSMHLVKRGVKKEFKFSSMHDSFKGKNAKVILSQIIDWMHDCNAICVITSKMNVKSTREIYGYDPTTSVAASAETSIAQIVSKASKSDLIMKEKKKHSIISNAIDVAIDRVQTGKSGNVLIFEGDGRKFNQHMILQLFDDLYEAIHQSINSNNPNLQKDENGKVEPTIWRTFMSEFYHYYEKKGVIVKLKEYYNAICWMILCTLASNKGLNYIPELNNNNLKMYGNIISEYLPFNSKLRIALLSYRTIKSKNDISIENQLNKHQKLNYLNADPKRKEEIVKRIKLGKACNQLINQCEYLMKQEWFGKYIRILVNEIMTKFNQIKQNPEEYINTIADEKIKNAMQKYLRDIDNYEINLIRIALQPIIDLKDQDLYIPTPWGMSQGILACSSSVYSSTCLKFVSRKLIKEKYIDWAECCATSDDLLIIATTSNNITDNFKLKLKSNFGQYMSELGIPLNPIKTNITYNPDFLNFNSTIYKVYAKFDSKIQNLHGRKFISMTRMLKNVWLQKVADPAVMFNSVSTNLKLLFTEFNFSKIERINFVRNGRLVSNQTQFVDYFTWWLDEISKEQFCSWPSARESINEFSDFALFSRKEIDLLWFVKNTIMKHHLNEKVTSTFISRSLLDKTFDANRVEYLNVDRDFINIVFNDKLIERVPLNLISINSNNVYNPKICFYYNGVMRDLTIRTSKPSTTLNEIVTNWDEMNSIQLIDNQQLINISKIRYGELSKEYKLHQWRSKLNDNEVSTTNIYYHFLKFFGSNLQSTNDPLGFRLVIKKLDEGGKLMGMLKSLRPFEVHSTKGVINLVSHFSETYREQIKFIMFLKLIGTPHISCYGGRVNYSFNNFAPMVKTSSDEVNWRIPMTALVESLLKLNPMNEYVYGFVPDDTHDKPSLFIENEIDKLIIAQPNASSTELISACMMMMSDSNYTLHKSNDALTGLVCPHIPEMTFNGIIGLPKQNQMMINYLKTLNFYDPFIMCQTKRNEAYTGPGVFVDRFTQTIFVLFHDFVVDAFWTHLDNENNLIRKQLNEIDHQLMPSFLRNYQFQFDLSASNRVMSMKFISGYWMEFGMRQKLARPRCMPLYSFAHLYQIDQLDNTSKQNIKLYLNRFKLFEQNTSQTNDWKFTVKTLTVNN